MPDRPSLHPETRVLYGDSLQPPPGYLFDAAVATTFSLDFETALAVPVSLALFAAEDRAETIANPFALLEGAERIAGRVVVFTDAGRIHASARQQSRLCALLERTIVEVIAPKGGAFHPKLWALRYRSVVPDAPVRVRLLVLSRNLTRDRSWDVSLRLDGEVGRIRRLNQPLRDLLVDLTGLGVVPLQDETRILTMAMAEDLHRTEWALPDGFESVSFAVNGFEGRPHWKPEPWNRLGVISPFCDTTALRELSSPNRNAEAPLIISRSDQLACIDGDTLDRYAQVQVLDEMAVGEDGEEIAATGLEGLHAKVFVQEKGWDTTITVGSGNATSAALVARNNVELFASLKGKRSRVGGIDSIMGDQGFGRLTRAFRREELEAADPAVRVAERQMSDARRAMSGGSLRLHCEAAGSDDERDAWHVRLLVDGPLALEGVDRLSVWPVTRGEGHARDGIEALRAGQAVDLGLMSLIDLTCFTAFRLQDTVGLAPALFSTQLVMEGLPSERYAAILRSVIGDPAGFLRYLRLLLSQPGDPFGAALAASKAAAGGKGNAGSSPDSPLLEDMVRSLCDGGERLAAVERLMVRLESGDLSAGDVVPDDFRTLWASFRAVLEDRERSS